ncbi:maspardin-like protein [Achlya hypogyna]|uniref:Maspardin n=1 Tax=Achlya hypogyna TaxID=1202772 RepID=A0A1V9ZFJ3_ACHHY|nr:maspardin-like protein [Achlya hypogyna]
MTLAASTKAFLGVAAKQRLATYDGKTWDFFDVGPRNAPPVVLLPGATGSPVVFHEIMTFVAQCGFRVLAVQYPVVWTYEEWVHSFDRFLTATNLSAVHVYGVCLGAMLAQRFCAAYPQRVLSLALTSGYGNIVGNLSRKMLSLMPIFYLKKYGAYALWSKRLTNHRIYMRQQSHTTIDKVSSTNQSDDMHQRYPDAKKARPRLALMKAHGSYPYLSHPDEVILYLTVHLRTYSSPTVS